MNEEDIFGLDDHEYWTDPWRTRRAVQRQLMEGGADEFVIGAPGSVPLNEQDTLPLAILRVCSPETAAKTPTKGTAVVAAVDLNTRELRAWLAADAASAAAPRPAGERKPDTFANDPTAMRSDAITVDLAERLEIPLMHGEHLVIVFMRDRMSNVLRMKLRDSLDYEDPAIGEFLREFKVPSEEPPEATPASEEGIASYDEHPRSPEIPDEPGVALAIERVNVLTSTPRCLAFGSYRLPVRARDRVERSRESEENDAGGDQESAEESVTALIPISLLMIGSVDPGPQILNMKIPSTAICEGELPLATGHFALDICQLLEFSERAQTYFIHAFCGEIMAGPSLAAFVKLPQSWEAAWEASRKEDLAATFAGDWEEGTSPFAPSTNDGREAECD